MPIPVALIPDRDVPPDVAKNLVGDRRTEGDYSAEEKQAHLESLVSDAGGCVRAFPSEQWTLEFDLARQPDLALIVHQAVKLAKGAANKTVAQIKTEAAAEVTAWQGAAGKSTDDVATEIYTPLKKSTVSKAQVAEQLAKLIEELPDDPATFRTKLPSYLANAIDHATGVIPANEDGQVAPASVPGGAAA
jgi:putative ATP-dependent endonuclease of OLD family